MVSSGNACRRDVMKCQNLLGYSDNFWLAATSAVDLFKISNNVESKPQSCTKESVGLVSPKSLRVLPSSSGIRVQV